MLCGKAARWCIGNPHATCVMWVAVLETHAFHGCWPLNLLSFRINSIDIRFWDYDLVSGFGAYQRHWTLGVRLRQRCFLDWLFASIRQFAGGDKRSCQTFLNQSTVFDESNFVLLELLRLSTSVKLSWNCVWIIGFCLWKNGFSLPVRFSIDFDASH